MLCTNPCTSSKICGFYVSVIVSLGVFKQNALKFKYIPSVTFPIYLFSVSQNEELCVTIYVVYLVHMHILEFMSVSVCIHKNPEKGADCTLECIVF